MSPPIPPPPFLLGQTVAIRSAEEISATLDEDGTLEGVPFMPEMVPLCGMTARIHRNVDKTCVEGYGMRHMTGTVLLEGLRCDGSAHDGCQRGCMFFWKEAWLRPVGEDRAPAQDPAVLDRLRDLPTRQGDRYVCQSTELHRATRPMSRWNLVHFFQEIRRGELTYPGFMQILVRTTLDRIRRRLGFRDLGGLTGVHRETPRVSLDLQPGEWVEVLSRAEIQATLDSRGRNAGLSFEPGMSHHLGGRFQVDHRLDRIIQEETGRMVHLTHTVTLREVTCQGPCNKNCPRNNALYWREAWLKRV